MTATAKPSRPYFRLEGGKHVPFCQTCKGDWPAFYKVKDSVWAAAGFKPDQMHCVYCLETKLGRKVTADDLEHSDPLNQVALYFLTT